MPFSIVRKNPINKTGRKTVKKPPVTRRKARAAPAKTIKYVIEAYVPPQKLVYWSGEKWGTRQAAKRYATRAAAFAVGRFLVKNKQAPAGAAFLRPLPVI